MDIHIDENHQSIRDIDSVINRLEYALSVAKKTTRVHQTSKKLNRAISKRKLLVYNLNKHNIFQAIEKELNSLFNNRIESVFDNLADIRDVLK